MHHEYTIIVGDAEEGMRLDRCLAQHLPESLSRTWIQKLIRQGHVTVNGLTARANHRLRPQDTVVARCKETEPQHQNEEPRAEPIPLEIVFEDEDLLVVNKPVGLVTHPAPGHWDGTLVNAVLWHLGRTEESQEQEETLTRAGIVHRLDKDTSGLLLIAKKATIHHLLSAQLKRREIKREYLAIVDGHPPMDAGKIDAPIARHPVNRKSMAIRTMGGRHAVTHYRVLKRFGIPYRDRQSSLRHAPDSKEAIEAYPCALLALQLETGRTHQIRVHMAHVGNPVSGDSVYGRHPSSYWEQLSIPRQLLHAWRLRFVHPVSGKTIQCTCDPPEDMRYWVSQVSISHLQVQDDPVE